ncbi:MAG: hypothetical protein HC815_30885 [Richelia sp. RM1_1_1]|nr:hypothetical protein [Richelia sp. RM1_1_1]
MIGELKEQRGELLTRYFPTNLESCQAIRNNCQDVSNQMTANQTLEQSPNLNLEEHICVYIASNYNIIFFSAQVLSPDNVNLYLSGTNNDCRICKERKERLEECKDCWIRI